jgi:L-malate glycosyltransferase
VRIALLAQRQSVHSVRWANALDSRGHQVHLLSSVHHGDELNPGVRFHPLPFRPPVGYFLNASLLRRELACIEPDILNTHFASGYGTLGRLSNFHPNVLSVWGSDVYDFPTKSPIHAWLLRQNLTQADWLCSTSRAMARQTSSLDSSVEAKLTVVPFGIDTELFAPAEPRPRDTLTIGTVKTLAPKYGIDLLLTAFASARRRLLADDPHLGAALRLLVVGGGPEGERLERQAVSLGIDKVTRFTGRVAHAEVPSYLHQLDVYVALSRLESESFGVAVLEASACGLPVVVSDVGGLPEVVDPLRTGIIVPRENAGAAAEKLIYLVRNPQVREELGARGRAHVLERYDWDSCVTLLEITYQRVLQHAIGRSMR